jgi:hypothetical protein
VKKKFNRLLKDAQKHVPQLDVDLEIGPRPEFPCARDYAYCEHLHDKTIKIVVACDFNELSDLHQEAILRHELGHAIEFELGVKRTHHDFGPLLSRTPERRADEIAELIWEEPILYDQSDLQTLDVGVYPRPERLGL